MLVLYQRGAYVDIGAPAAEQIDREHPSISIARQKLQEDQAEQAANLLSRIPFGILHQRNERREAFLLHALVPIHELDKLRTLLHENLDTWQPFRDIAKAFERAGVTLDGIAVHAEATLAPVKSKLRTTLKQHEVQEIVAWIGVEEGRLASFTRENHRQFYQDLKLPYDPEIVGTGSTRQKFVTILGEAPPDHQARILRGILERCHAGPASPNRTRDRHARLISYLDRLTGVLPQPSLSGGEVVRQALRDIEVLLEAQGPASTVDRAHTALHGYLREKCADMVEPPAEDATIPAIWKQLMRHPQMCGTGARPEDILKVLRSMSGALDALGSLRNQTSLSHPNKSLLPNPEARLVLNFVFALLHYVESKFNEPSSSKINGQ